MTGNLNYISTIILFLTLFYGYGQDSKFNNWTEKEKEQYKILNELAHYVSGRDSTEISKEVLFDKYIEFEYILNDTLHTRKEDRIQKFDGFFYYFRKTIDSLGIENLDAGPIRFYKNHGIYESFENQLLDLEPNVFAYYEKDDPTQPKGVLLFDDESNKLLTWILLSQGGYRFFLLFNLM